MRFTMMNKQQEMQNTVIEYSPIQSLSSWLKSALSDGTDPSTSRLLVMMCIPFIVIAPIMTWIVMSIVSKKMLDFPASVTGYVMSMSTLLLGLLHLNKREETKENIAITTKKHA